MSNSRVHTFYVVRHGETVGNSAKVFLSPEEDVLSPTGGIVEAGLLGEELKDVKFTKVYCSPYPRAVATTEIILSKNNSSEKCLEKDVRLREIDLGKYDRGTHSDLFKAILQLSQQGLSKMEWRLEGAETINDVTIRAKSFAEDLYKELDSSEKDEAILLVSHGVFNMSLFEMLYKSPDINFTNWDDSCVKFMRNATYMTFTLSSKSADSKRTMTFLNIHEKSHLEEIVGVDSLTKTAKTAEATPLSGCFQV